MPQDSYKALLSKALEAERAYHELDAPIMSDADYDAIVRRLKEMEDADPSIKLPSSPTSRVGGHPVSSFDKVPFPQRMLSLANAFTADEVHRFVDRTLALAGEGYVVQPKLDGLTLVLFYENHMLVRAATRGNGDVGEDVTQNALMIKSIPVKIKEEKLIVRGEVVIHKHEFETLNLERQATGAPLFANPRNAAAGGVRNKDPRVTRFRRLTFYAYDIPGLNTGTECNMLYILQTNGFLTPQMNFVSNRMADPGEFAYYVIMSLKSDEYKIPYAIDGAVIKTDDRAKRLELGEGVHDPKWSIAFKFTPVEAVTELKGVVWQVGRKGTLTPVAVLEPVGLCGSTVTHASLHNIDYIKEMDLKLGDMVAVYKAAEIIPQLDHVVESMGGAEVPIPGLCPECGAPLVRDGAVLLCPNDDCVAKLHAEICYFVSRQCMDIRGMADAMIHALIMKGKLKSPADLYKLTKEDLQLPGISKDLKADSVLAEIEKSKQKPFDRVLCAIGIDGIGTTNAKIIAKHFGSMLTLLKASIPEIAEIEGFAEITARSIFISIHSPHKATLINDLSLRGLCMEQTKTELVSEKLTGLSFCITGTLSQSRDQIKKLIEDHGGKFVSSVSSSTSYLLAGEGGGSKRSKAEKLGITIINEQQFKELFNDR